MNEKQIIVQSPDQMEKLGEKIGSQITPGSCMELKSDLGGGKTTFTRGFVRGIGSTDTVSSPTFTISKRYKSDKLTCYHFDFYRLQEPGLVAEELREALEDPMGIIIVEWADTVSGVMPKDRIIIKIDPVPENSETRKCTIYYPENRQEILENL